jgi:hypothetical protein
MTLLESTFVYGSPPGARELRALDNIRDVYGIRQLSVDERAHTIRVEYDASRLTKNDLAALVRNAGVDLPGGIRIAA